MHMQTNEQSILDGAQAVVDIAAYFEELKSRATAMQQQVQAQDRGYFTPTEDEQTRQLLVSYCQSRAALFDVVDAFRDQDWSDPRADKRAFAVAYAAAVLLVDAARFVRESFSDRPIVIAKLNEAEPAFGVVAGTYDTIQASLTDPVNLWRLRQAKMQYEEIRPQLLELKSDLQIGPVLDVIDRLGHRLDFPALDLVAARVDVRSKQVVDGLKHAALGVVLYAIQEWAGDWAARISVLPLHRPRLPRAIDRKLCDVMQPGDVIVVRKQFALTNYFLPGYWPHAALYLGDISQLEQIGLHAVEEMRPRWSKLLGVDTSRPHRVLEAQKDGVHFRSIASPWASDCAVVIRPMLATEQVATALQRGVKHEGKPYDFDFDFSRSDRMVCSEVVYRTYEGVGPIRMALTPRAGRLTLAAEDLLRLSLKRQGFEPIAVYAPPHATRLVLGDAVDDVLRATMADG